jgi:cytochrome P450
MPEPISLSMRRQRTFDPPPELEQLLRTGRSLHRLRFRGGEVGWLVTGYHEARAVLKDARFSLRPWPPLLVEDPDKHSAYVDLMRRTGLQSGDMLTLDPPEHTTLRRALASKFSINGLNELELPAKIDAIVSRCLDRMEDAGPPADLVEAFAAPVAQLTHCALIGVDEDAIPMLKMIGETVTNTEQSAEQAIADTERFREYLQGVVERKRAEPGNDLMSHIIERDELTEDQILGVLVMLFIAGVDTTASALGTGIFALLCHVEQLEALRADMCRVNEAVEELTRYLTTLNVGSMTRTALEDVELDGAVIRAGEIVSVSLLGANRDGERFERPNELDLQRGGKGQLGFGTGVHVCIGQHLARLEMRTGYTRLLERFPELRLAVPTDEIPISGEFDPTFRALRVPVAW